MKVVIVKEVMTGDVSPVAMFLKWLGIIDHLDLEPFSFHISISIARHFHFTFHSRKEWIRFSFHFSLLEMSATDFHFTYHFSNFQYPLSQDTASTILHQPVKKRNRYYIQYQKKISTSRKTHEALGWLHFSPLLPFSSKALTGRTWPNIITRCSICLDYDYG